MTDTVIREIQTLKNQVYNQNQELELLNKKIDQILDEIDFREIKKNCNYI